MRSGLSIREAWEELVGSKVCNGYLLRELIGSTESSAVYLTAYGEERAALKLMAADAASPDIPAIDHPNILRSFAHGRCTIGGSPFRYVVTEFADENLATVIASRPLTPDETRETLAPVLDALGYLHGKGLVHGAIKPSNILAKG